MTSIYFPPQIGFIAEVKRPHVKPTCFYSSVYSHHFTWERHERLSPALWSRCQGHRLPPLFRCHLLKGSLTPTCNSGTLNGAQLNPNDTLDFWPHTQKKGGQPAICIAVLVFSGERAISMCNECVVCHSPLLVNNYQPLQPEVSLF